MLTAKKWWQALLNNTKSPLLSKNRDHIPEINVNFAIPFMKFI